MALVLFPKYRFIVPSGMFYISNPSFQKGLDLLMDLCHPVDVVDTFGYQRDTRCLCLGNWVESHKSSVQWRTLSFFLLPCSLMRGKVFWQKMCSGRIWSSVMKWCGEILVMLNTINQFNFTLFALANHSWVRNQKLWQNTHISPLPPSPPSPRFKSSVKITLWSACLSCCFP